jgi:hypothetical protein
MFHFAKVRLAVAAGCNLSDNARTQLIVPPSKAEDDLLKDQARDAWPAASSPCGTCSTHSGSKVVPAF